CDDFTWLSFANNLLQSKGDALGEFFATPVSVVQPFLSCYRPFPFVVLFAEFVLAGANPFWYHFTNLVCHCLCTFFVFLATEELLMQFSQPDLRSTSRWGACAAAALFGCYPLNGEVVAFPMNIVTLLCATFSMAALSAFMYFCRSRRSGWLCASLTCFALALL